MNREFLFSFLLFLLLPSLSFAECDIPEGAQTRDMRVTERSGIYSGGNYSSGFAVNYSLLEDYRVQVIGEAENGFYQICYDQMNSGVLAPVMGYMPAENLAETNGTDQLGPACGFREVNTLAPTPRMDRGVITETIAAVEMNQNTGFFDPCTDIGNFTAGAPVDVIRYGTDTTGERWARVRVHSDNYGVIEGWIPANKVRIDYDGLTEAGYDHCENCAITENDVFGDIREIRDNILPPGVSPRMYCDRNQGERACMVCNCFREAGGPAGGEPYAGRLAVVLTTVQRSEAPTRGWPNDICSVVYQGENARYPQFEWTGQRSTRQLGSRSAIAECVAAANQGMNSDTPWPYDHFVNLNTYGSPSWFRACGGYRRSGDNPDSWNNPACYGPRNQRPSHCMNYCEPTEVSASCIKRIGNHWFCHGPMPYTLQH
jgi:hypothetical protein